MLCSLVTDRQTDTKVTTVGTLSGFQEFFLQPIIKDRPKKETRSGSGSRCSVIDVSGVNIKR